MNRIIFLIFSSFCFHITVFAQQGSDTTRQPIDTIHKKDSNTVVQRLKPDSTLPLVKQPTHDSGKLITPFTHLSREEINQRIIESNSFFGFRSDPTVIQTGVVHWEGKELLFYAMIVLMTGYALLRSAFPKYFNDLFRLFFRSTIKQRQIREQLMQTPLPSLLWNAFFVISGGLYLAFMIRHFGLDPFDNFWLIFFYSTVGISLAYLVKFLFLKLAGWLFSMKEVADSYIFIVFIINKMLGILWLPFLVLLAFAEGNVYTAALSLSWCLVAGLLGYRVILTYTAIRNQVKVNPFHFFLYFCAFEVAPLLLIYKALLFFFRITA